MEGMTPTSIVYLLRYAKRTWNPERAAALAADSSTEVAAATS